MKPGKLMATLMCALLITAASSAGTRAYAETLAEAPALDGSVPSVPNSGITLSIKKSNPTLIAQALSGGCGDGLTWELASDGVLRISGEGEMRDYFYLDLPPWFDAREEIKQVIVEDGVTSVGSWSFCLLSNLEQVSIQGSVSSIGTTSFYGCKSLKSIDIHDGVTEIGNGAFCGCVKLGTVTLPRSIDSVGVAAFDETEWAKGQGDYLVINGILCDYLGSEKEVSVPEGVNTIGAYAFSACASLSGIRLPTGLENLGDGVFCSCESLEFACVPEGITAIGYAAFSDCYKLESIYLPDSITQISFYAFNASDGLKHVYFGGSEDDWNKVKIDWDGNNPLANATVHYGYRGIVPEIALSNESYVYDGKVKRPDVAVSYEGETIDPSLYSVSYDEGLKNSGVYKLKVKMTAKGNANYEAGSKTITVKLKVK